MKLKDIKISIHAFETRIPLIEESIDTRKIVFCEIETDEGVIGQSYGLTTIFLLSGVVAVMENEILPLVRGMDIRETEAIHHKIWWALNPRAATGAISCALSVFDMACWDAHGKKEGRTCAQLMGGARNHAPAYVTYGFPNYDDDQLVQAAKDFVAKGFKRLKIVVGAKPHTLQDDIRRTRAVRDAVGDEVELMADANYMFSPVEAKLYLRGVEDCSLTWMEEPLYANDTRALADLRRSTATPIAAGQMEGSRWRLRQLVEAQAVDILQPNCSYNGGFTETRKVGHMAQAFNLLLANGGGWPRLNMHTMAGLMNGWRVEFHMGMKNIEDQFITNAPEPDGAQQIITINDAPGLGLNFDKDVLRDTRVPA